MFGEERIQEMKGKDLKDIVKNFNDEADVMIEQWDFSLKRDWVLVPLTVHNIVELDTEDEGAHIIISPTA